MSMESPREVDVEAAMELINNNAFLSRDPYAKRVAESGTADNGEPVDVGNFLAARAAILEKWDAEARLAAAEGKDRQAYKVAVTNSVKPEVERSITE